MVITPTLSPSILVRVLVLVLMRRMVIMRQGRGSEATEAVFCLQAKKALHSGSYEHRVPKIKNKTFFCTRDVYLFIC